MESKEQMTELKDMSLEDYIEFKKDKVSSAWKDNHGENRDIHEYLKGQFIILRELTEPKYRRNEP